jgi:hypothetical protein
MGITRPGTIHVSFLLSSSQINGPNTSKSIHFLTIIAFLFNSLGKAGDDKSIAQPEFRKALGDKFNLDLNGQHRYNGNIGNATARLQNSTYSDTVYAYVHKNTMIVTLDPFYQESPYNNIAMSGTVAMRIVGDQLDWLDNVLGEARKLPEIKHIFVQAHTPVLHPVRKSRSSGQMLEGEETSEFWKTLRKHNVDIYFAGEVSILTLCDH